MFKCSLCIPVINAGKYANILMESIASQTLEVESIIVVDSSSVDNTRQYFTDLGATLYCINRNEFNHGNTRNIFLDLDSDSDVLIFLTQDALLSDTKSLENLLLSFSDPAVGVAYGRQLPRPGAGPIESHARLFNYPPNSHVKNLSDVPSLGIKTAFISNSFAAYRRTALEEVGGFPANVILSEDTFVAARMLLAGWKIAYCAEAQVYHSHNYNYLQEFRRYFDIGVFHAREPWIRQSFGQAEGEGLRFVLSELKFLWPAYFYLIPSAILRNFLKFLAFRMGALEGWLPRRLKVALSIHKAFWR